MSEWREGGCHCGAVRFKIRGSFERVLECNCSICRKKGYLHLIAPSADFECLSGERELTLYQFNTKTAKHYFCRHCGVAPFYIPRSHPDGYDVNARCFDGFDPDQVRIEPFNGREWEKNIREIEGYDS